jgi:hypothetical protein
VVGVGGGLCMYESFGFTGEDCDVDDMGVWEFTYTMLLCCCCCCWCCCWCCWCCWMPGKLPEAIDNEDVKGGSCWLAS